MQSLALSKALRSFAAVAALLPATAAADSIASRLSPEWRALAAEVRTLDAALVHLPGIPVEDLGCTRPFLRVFKRPDTMDDLRVDFTIRLNWPEARPVDFVALVPARKIDTLGLDPNYGFPEDFTVSLIPPDGALEHLAAFSAMSDHPRRAGTRPPRLDKNRRPPREFHRPDIPSPDEQRHRPAHQRPLRRLEERPQLPSGKALRVGGQEPAL